MNRYIATLMLSTFTLGLSEFMPMGLLPLIAESLSISIPSAGMIITAYAVGVMIASPIVTLSLSRFTKKSSLITLLLIFIIGSILSITAQGYYSLLISRIVTSIAHGSFFGISSILAMTLTKPEKSAGAVSLLFMGLTIANIIGVPVATILSNSLGWRYAFVITTVLGLIAIITTISIIPNDEKAVKLNIYNEIKELFNRSVIVTFLGTIIFASSLFTLYTYIAVVLQTTAGATPNFIAIILAIIGIGFTLGGYISGYLAINWSIDKSIALFFFLTAITMFIYPIVATTYIGAVVITLIWGIVGYATSPLLQTKIISSSQKSSALASSINIGVFNFGNAIGAVVGGSVIKMGFGYEWIAPVGGAISLLGVLTVILPMIIKRLSKESNPVFEINTVYIKK